MNILTKKTKTEFTLIFLLSCVVAVCNVGQPLVSSTLLDYAIAGEFKNIINGIIKLVGITILLLMSEYMRKIITSDYKKRVSDTLKAKLLHGVINRIHSVDNSKNNQEYIAIFNNEADEIIENYYVQLTDIVFFVFSIIIYSLSLISLNPLLAVVIFITNLIPMVIPVLFGKKIEVKKERSFEALHKYNVRLADTINGCNILKMHNIQNKVENMTGESCKKATKLQNKYENEVSLCEIITGLFSYVNYLAIIITGVVLICKGMLTPGGLLAAVSVSDLLVGPVTSIAYEWNGFCAINAVRKKLFKEYRYSNDTDDNQQVDYSNNQEGVINNIELRDISCSYGDRMVIDSVNITFEKGKKYLIHGYSGSGKSTLFKIISGIIKDYKGDININGRRIDEMSESEFYKNVGFAMQTPFIFNDTLKNNITLFNEDYDAIALKEVVDRLDLNRIEDDIINGKMYVDAENNISGGEKQKINLARLLMENKKILFLDEATSAIDLKSSNKIMRELLHDKELTIVSIEHKVSDEIEKMYDVILELKDGKLCEVQGIY